MNWSELSSRPTSSRSNRGEQTAMPWPLVSSRVAVSKGEAGDVEVASATEAGTAIDFEVSGTAQRGRQQVQQRF